jgi:lactoylglutathione lyase
MADRPFRILGVQSIALGSENKAAMLKLWSELFGLEHSGTFKSMDGNIDVDVLRLQTGERSVEISIMEPISGKADSKKRRAPLHRIGLWVDDLPAAVQYLKDHGVNFVERGLRSIQAGYDVACIHPRHTEKHPHSGCGIFIELIQAPPEMIKKNS